MKSGIGTVLTGIGLTVSVIFVIVLLAFGGVAASIMIQDAQLPEPTKVAGVGWTKPTQTPQVSENTGVLDKTEGKNLQVLSSKSGFDQQPFEVSDDEITIYILTNQARRDAGRKPLVYDVDMSQSARNYSLKMRDKNIWAHASDSERNGNGENLLRVNNATNNSPAFRHAGYMASPGHKKNLLTSYYTRMGVGDIAKYNGIWDFWNTERFSTEPIGCADGLEATLSAGNTKLFVTAWNEHAKLCDKRSIALVTKSFVNLPARVAQVLSVKAEDPDPPLEPPLPPNNAVIASPKAAAPKTNVAATPVPTPRPLRPGTQTETDTRYIQQPKPAPTPQIIYRDSPPQIIYKESPPQIVYVPAPQPVEQYNPPAQPVQPYYPPATSGGVCVDKSRAHGTWQIGQTTPGGWLCLEGNRWQCTQAQCASAEVPNGSYNGLINPGWGW